MSTGLGPTEIPLAERMRPRRLDEIEGQGHILGPDKALYRALAAGRVFPMILWGPPGSGKTTLARVAAEAARLPCRSLSAVTAGVKDIRAIIDEAHKASERWHTPSILFVDEIHRFNKAQQDAFLPHVESGLIILIGATTENPSFEVISPLLSRTRVIVLKPLTGGDLERILRRALADEERGLGRLHLTVQPAALAHLVRIAQGDARVALNFLENAVYLARDERGEALEDLTLADVERAADRKALLYDKGGEEHYNLISALHKSLRGGDAQAALYWLYRMLAAGEDPLYIARRLIRFASEDVGLADPNALGVTLNAFDAWHRVGPPEAELALAQAVAYLARAPKSNALYLAAKAVKEEIKSSGALPVPLHLRNAPTRLMQDLGYGRDYRYPHDFPGARVAQAYLPPGLHRTTFYRPTGRGAETQDQRRGPIRALGPEPATAPHSQPRRGGKDDVKE